MSKTPVKVIRPENLGTGLSLVNNSVTLSLGLESKKIYVSSSKGNDTNNGTKQGAYRTIAKAFEQMQNLPTEYTILLHEGDTFEWDIKSVPFANVVIGVYSSTREIEDKPDEIHKAGFNRPTITVKVKKDQTNSVVYRQALVARDVKVRGIKFNIEDKAETGTNSYTGVFEGFITSWFATFSGCTLEIINSPKAVSNKERSGALIKSVFITWFNSKLLNAIDAKQSTDGADTFSPLIDGMYTKVITIGKSTVTTPLVNSIEDVARSFDLTKVPNIVFNKAEKKLFGLDVNWDFTTLS